MKLQSIFYNSNLIKACMLFLCFFSYIPFLHFIPQLLFKFFIVWGVLYCFISVCYRKSSKISAQNILFLLFVLLFIVTLLLNGGEYFLTDFKQMLYCLIMLFLVYPEKSLTTKNRNKFIKNISRMFIFLTFIASSISILMFYVSYTSNYKGSPIGIYKNRLYGVYNSPNVMGILALISMLLSLLLWDHFKNKKLCYILNVIVQSCVISVSLSRGTLFSLFLSFGFYLFFKYWHSGYRSIINDSKRLVYALFCSLIGLILIFSLYTLFKYSNNYIQAQIKSEVKITQEVATPKQDLSITQYINNNNSRIDTNTDTSSWRIPRWKYALKTLEKNVLFGTGQKNIHINSSQIASSSEKWLFKTPDGGVHNIYLEILVANGVLGGGIILLFLLLCALKLLHFFFYYPLHENYQKVLWLSTILIAIASNNLIESTIFYVIFPQTIFFWCFLGICISQIRKVPYGQKTQTINYTFIGSPPVT